LVITVKIQMAIKVIEVGTNRKPLCEFLLVITDILSRTVAFLLGGLGTTYDAHLGVTHWKVC